jgi:hypothetical protein
MLVRFLQPHEGRRCSDGKRIATPPVCEGVMRDKLSAAVIVFMLAAACGRGSMTRDQKNYETVEEGSASGVTSTIQGPGETLPPITNTNSDATTAFAFDPNAYPNQTPTAVPTTSTAYVPPTTYPTTTHPTTTYAPPPPPVRRPPPPPPPPATTTTAEPEPEPTPPPPTDTSTTTAEPAPPPPPPPATDTAATSTEEPPPPPPPSARK